MSAPLWDPAKRGTVEIDGLSFDVDGARLLNQIDLVASPGEIVGVIGPNGAGKSTLLRCVAGLIRPRAGEVRIEGCAQAARHPRELARRLAFVTQHPPPTHGFTALEIVLAGRHPHLGRMALEGERDHELALSCMEQTGTRRFAARLASTLSGGELQRVFLARALAQGPSVLLLDEPTSSLDVLHQLAVFELLRDLSAKGLTVIVAAHDLQLAARFCSRLALLSHGALLADGVPADVITARNLADAFGVEAVISLDVSGELAISYRGRATAAGATI